MLVAEFSLEPVRSRTMKVSVSSDEYGCFDEELIRRIEGVMEGALERFGDRIAAVEVSLSDPEGMGPVRAGMSCHVEVRLLQAGPVAASHQGSTLAEAIHGAAAKLKRSLNGQLRRRTPALPLPPALSPETIVAALPAAIPVVAPRSPG